MCHRQLHVALVMSCATCCWRKAHLAHEHSRGTEKSNSTHSLGDTASNGNIVSQHALMHFWKTGTQTCIPVRRKASSCSCVLKEKLSEIAVWEPSLNACHHHYRHHQAVTHKRFAPLWRSSETPMVSHVRTAAQRREQRQRAEARFAGRLYKRVEVSHHHTRQCAW